MEMSLDDLKPSPLPKRHLELRSSMTRSRSGSDPVPVVTDDPSVPAVVRNFKNWTLEDPEIAAAVAAVRALTTVIKTTQGSTLQEVLHELELATKLLKECSSALSVESACALFTRFVTRTTLETPHFEECTRRLIERGDQYTQQAMLGRDKIGKFADTFIRDGLTVLTHGFSRVVLAVLERAHRQGKHFSVVVTESRPDGSGYVAAHRLQAASIPVQVVVDAAVAHVMDQVDLVLVGSEGIVENGGIINKVGTYQMALVASALNKPFYVAAEARCASHLRAPVDI
eukprot:TRINITY_DN11220_c0_g1_i1.p1 TRINITY_DN11220_c0_g1~~TRINITY_DN11220_c0_g1_i1.p1  ORF type:complete len:295 (+),score=79.36 TRINITY_DN11220_c0_g1_i1:32-886(+)